MPQAPKSLCLIHFWSWENSLFSVLALRGNNNWPPSIKVKQIEIFQVKMRLKGCKWSSLNVPGTQIPLSHFFWSWEISLFSVLALWGNKNWLPSIKVKQIEIFQNKMSLKGCKWSSLNAPGTQIPLSHSFLELGEFPFLSISPLWDQCKGETYRNFPERSGLKRMQII